MAKKPTKKADKPAHVFAHGDWVEILHFGKGKIVELRGALGPGGAEVYRVMYRRKPRPGYIEVLGEQIRLLDVTKRPKPSKKVPSTSPETPTAAGK
jgi:hypothetical protein